MLDILKRKSTHVIGLDISSSSIKLIELSRFSGQYRVDAYATVPLPPDAVVENEIRDIEVVAEAIKLAVARAHTHTHNVAIAVPSSCVISKTLYLDDDLSEQELGVLIEREANRYIPYPLDEVRSDYEVVGPTNDGSHKLEVNLAASRMEHVDVRVDLLREAGLTARVVDVESYAMERACRLIANQFPDRGQDLAIAVIDLGASITSINILHNLKSVYTREEVFGGRQLTSAIQQRYGLGYEEAGRAKKHGGLPPEYERDVLEPFRESLLPLIRRSLQFFFSNSDFNKIDYILLAGGGAFLPGLRDLFKENLGIASGIANPFTDMTVSSRIDIPALAADAPSLMIACGLALRSF